MWPGIGMAEGGIKNPAVFSRSKLNEFGGVIGFATFASGEDGTLRCLPNGSGPANGT
jgi:hypothetical protein